MTTNIPVLSVSELSGAVKKTLETGFGRVRVRGELSGVKRHSSGHCYWDLKDDKAVINSVCWRGTSISIQPENGMEVICTGRLTTYIARSNYQLVIESMELAGEGALLKLLEDRKKRFAEEGLFAPEHKKKIPFLPERIGVITSPTGAVIRDILHRIEDRCPVSVLVWPVAVQGPGAAEQITAAVSGFNAAPSELKPDLLIVARGGGSLEDLMAFNEENVVRAVFGSSIPVISAVGHETDTTLIDFVSDLRAPTPTAAAEMAVPVRSDLVFTLGESNKRMMRALSQQLQQKKMFLKQAQTALIQVPKHLDYFNQRLDDFTLRLIQAPAKSLHVHQLQFNAAKARLRFPAHLLEQLQGHISQLAGRMQQSWRGFDQLQKHLAQLHDRMQRSWQNRLNHDNKALAALTALLESYSYRNVLKRGFALITDENHHAVSTVQQLKPEALVTISFFDGDASARIVPPDNR